MKQQSNLFPMFFTVERVENGYILSVRTDNEDECTDDPGYKKEVVTNDRIDARIGHLLCLDILKKEVPVVFHVEAVNSETYKTEDTRNGNGLMAAKLSYCHFHGKKYPHEPFFVFQIEETNMLEIYGWAAEIVAQENDIALMRSEGIPFLRFPDSKEGRKAIASLVPNPVMVKASEAEILDWYASRRVMVETPSRTSDKNSSPTSNTTRK